MVGSEGTLGVITEITVRLYGIPEATSAAVVSFDDIENAVNAVILVIQSGIPIARIELLDEVQIDSVNRYSQMDLAVAPTLFLEFHGTQAGVEEQAERVGEICREFGAGDFRWATQQEDRNRLWQARHDVAWASKALRPGCRLWPTDVCVPISRLAECIVETKKDLAGSTLIAPLAGHVGDGNFHLVFLLDPDDPAELEEATRLNLPEPVAELVPLDAAAPAEAEVIRARMAEIDMTSTGSFIGLGTRAQLELKQISQAMLTDVKNKDLGPAGDGLRQMVSTIRGFSVSELDTRRDRSWWERLTGKAAPMANFMARYETVQGQIDKITESLLGHETQLLKDIKSLDLLYEKTLDFYNELALYITAGEAKLKELDEETIPAKQAEVEAADPNDTIIRAQELRDLRAARDDLERRVHDLKLTRQVTMQSLPSIRLVQENDKALVTKINSTLVNTVPLWETQLAQALTIQRSKQAAEAVRAANDLTNEMLQKNADNLRQANREVREQVERGVFDIEAVKHANEQLIATIQDSLEIADAGKAKRAAAETELQKMEAELRESLSAARARATN
jgi:uncharacterized protein YaaN involved in tellurite resistance